MLLSLYVAKVCSNKRCGMPAVPGGKALYCTKCHGPLMLLEYAQSDNTIKAANHSTSGNRDSHQGSQGSQGSHNVPPNADVPARPSDLRKELKTRDAQKNGKDSSVCQQRKIGAPCN